MTPPLLLNTQIQNPPVLLFQHPVERPTILQPDAPFELPFTPYAAVELPFTPRPVVPAVVEEHCFGGDFFLVKYVIHAFLHEFAESAFEGVVSIAFGEGRGVGGVPDGLFGGGVRF